MTGPLPDPARMGAHWCDDHDRWECTRLSKRSGGRCHNIAILGLDRCMSHSGESLEVAKARGEAARATLSAWSALGVGAAFVPVIDSATAVLGMLQISWLRAHLYAALLADQVHREGAAGVPGVTEDGEIHGDGSGLIGHTLSSGKEGPFANAEAIRGLAVLEAQERDRCVRTAKTAHDMGIAEAQIRLAERQGELLAGGLRWLFDRLDLDARQRERVPELAASMLHALASGDLGQLPVGPS